MPTGCMKLLKINLSADKAAQRIEFVSVNTKRQPTASGSHLRFSYRKNVFLLAHIDA